ncbi:MAG: thiamine phosphate synthase, partial [Brevibacterium sp.]|nr:thiamine phosphate synthase [Brevibacterium sp.]
MTTDTTIPDQGRAQRLDRLREAALYVCTDARAAQGDLSEFLDAAYAGGVDIIQLRDKNLEARAEIEALEVLRDAAHRHGKLFSVNDRADVALLVGADVFHVGQGDLTSEQARTVLGPDVLLGRSPHSIAQANAAAAESTPADNTAEAANTPTTAVAAAANDEETTAAAETADPTTADPTTANPVESAVGGIKTALGASTEASRESAAATAPTKTADKSAAETT